MDPLTDLEEKVHAVAKELAGARKQNSSLRARIKKLEAQVAESGEADSAASEWRKERDQVRRRVEQLAAGLEALL